MKVGDIVRHTRFKSTYLVLDTHDDYDMGLITILPTHGHGYGSVTNRLQVKSNFLEVISESR